MPTIYGPNQLAALYTASVTPDAGTLALRDGSGRIETATPSGASDAATKSYVDGKAGSNPALITASQTAVAGGYYQVDATGGAVTITMPSAPANGTVVTIIKNDSSANVVNYVRGGTDTIEGSTGTFVLDKPERVELIYVSASTQWLLHRELSDATAGTTMRRDGSGRSQVADPSVAADIATKNYTDSKFSQPPSYAGTGLLNQFDPRRSIYNWKSSNTRWLRRGLAIAARGGKSDQLVIGDSISSGAVSGIGTTVYDRPNAWPMAMRNALAGMGVPIGGSGMVRPIDNTSTDARYTSTGTWANNGIYIFSTTASSSLTFTPDVSGTMLDVQYYNNALGTFTIAVNGVVVRTVTGSGTTVWKHARITGQNIVANQTKITITLTVVNTSGIIFAGMNVYTPNGGLIVHNVAQSGSRASGNTGINSWTDTTSTGNSASPYATFGDSAGRVTTITDAGFTASSVIMTSASSTFTVDDIGKPVDMMAVPTTGIVLPENTYIASINSTTSVNLNVAAYVSATAQTVNIDREPHVVHLAIGGNDMLQLGLTSLSATTTALTTLRNRYPNSDVILHLFHNASTTLQSQATQDAFAAAYYQLADTLDIPLFDWRDRVGTYAQAQANGIMGDYQVHLKGSGYAMIGSLMAEVIGESAGKTQGNYPITQDFDFATKKYVDDRVKSVTAVNLATITTTTETVVMSMPIPANSLKVGSAYDYSLALKPAIASGTTVRVRIGTAGTIADAAVVTMSVTVAQTSALARHCRGAGGISVIGASAAHTGVGTEAIHAIAPAVGSAGAITTAGTFDSTKDNILTVTVQNGTSTTTTLNAGRLELTY